jgi:uncharacterized protein (UPF0333 family)
MKKFRKNESGFSATELLIIVVVLILVGVAGWFINKEHNNINSTNSKTVSCPAGKEVAVSAANGEQRCVNDNYNGTTD